MIGVLSAFQGAVLACAFLWKLYHLSRAPHDRALRAVVACLALAVLVYPIDVATSASAYGPFSPSLVSAVQSALVMGVVYCILAFFLYVAYPPTSASRRARWQLLPLLVGAAVTLTLASLVPRGTPGHDYSDPLVAASLLTSDCYIVYIHLAVIVTARRCADGASPTVRHGVAVISTALAVGAAAIVGFMAALVVPFLGGGFPAAVRDVAAVGALLGIVGFLIGVCYPGAAMRLRAGLVWLGHLRDIHHLSLLWRSLGEAFPDYALERRGRIRWWQAWSLRGVHRRRHRHQMECRDGLVDLSPYLAAQGAAVNENGTIAAEEAARCLRAALRARAASPQAGTTPIGVALPEAPGLDADVRQLVRVSQALRRSPAPQTA